MRRTPRGTAVSGPPPDKMTDTLRLQALRLDGRGRAAGGMGPCLQHEVEVAPHVSAVLWNMRNHLAHARSAAGFGMESQLSSKFLTCRRRSGFVLGATDLEARRASIARPARVCPRHACQEQAPLVPYPQFHLRMCHPAAEDVASWCPPLESGRCWAGCQCPAEGCATTGAGIPRTTAATARLVQGHSIICENSYP